MRTLTIGEVLNRLKDEFDDVTISKIRFLEAEGLIRPDRTESGYRKFTASDIDRLRYVLRAQRDRYLPLKVIKEELDRLDAGLPVEAPAEPVASPLQPDSAGAGQSAGDAPALLDSPGPEVHLSAAELADASGLTEGDVQGLREHGLIGAGPTHGTEDLEVVKLAADLLAAGLEARHLRMYRQFADREAALVEQLVTPSLRQRNPDSRRAATELAERVAASGGALHRALLARQLRAALRA